MKKKKEEEVRAAKVREQKADSKNMKDEYLISNGMLPPR
jgi:hypothetical protein